MSACAVAERHAILACVGLDESENPAAAFHRLAAAVAEPAAPARVADSDRVRRRRTGNGPRGALRFLRTPVQSA